MANKTVLDFIQTTTIDRTDIMYIIQGVGLDRDKKIEIKDLLDLPDTDNSNKLRFNWSENDSANRILNFEVNGADRIIDLSGNLTLTGNNQVTDWSITGELVIGGNVQLSRSSADVLTLASGDTFVTGGETSPLCVSGGIHVKTGESSAGVNAGYDDFVVEGNAETGMTILSGSTSPAGIAFGSTVSPFGGIISYDNSAESMSLFSSATLAVTIDNSQNLILATGNLTLAASKNLNIGTTTLTSTSSNVLSLTSGNSLDIISGTLKAGGGVDAGSTGTFLKTKVIEIGDWNMDTSQTRFITSTGVDISKIRNITAIIRSDAGTTIRPLSSFDTGTETINGGVVSLVTGSPQLTLARTTGGDFDNANYDSTSYNRGWVYITYEA